ncbi:ATP-dependent metallopeptidase FtsH/Yme1/Tma family protein [Rossellomorea marisflavi]|uniref:ATP-dependent metallopeptidase FtsH/Yme1/Tma family protein n=1 Tax=Rossellomorea marisflavi TaxID=189381 RepID=UPI003FA0AE95
MNDDISPMCIHLPKLMNPTPLEWHQKRFGHRFYSFTTNLKYEIQIERGLLATMNPKLKKVLKSLGMFFLVALVLIALNPFGSGNEVKEKKYTEFQEQVKNKEVASVQINKLQGRVTYEGKNEKVYVTEYPDYDEFKKELLEQGIDTTSKTPVTFLSFIQNYAFLIFFIVIIIITIGQTRAMRGVGGKQASTKAVEKPNVTFANVAGYKEVKEEVQIAVDILKNGKKYKDKGARMPKGMMLYGSPGTGKTLLAKAVAGEAGVPFFSANGADFVEKFVGMGANRIRSLFNEAKKKAPCIIFIDEIDAIGGVRGDNMHSEQLQTLNALLSELDGFASDSGVFVIATTNRLESLDPALIRSGRFDLHVKVPLPQTPQERMEIMAVHAKGKTFAEDVDFKNLAKQWMGFSGADIESVFNGAAILSVTEGKEAIDMANLDEAFYKQALGGHFKKGTHKERDEDELKLVAYHEAGHAVVEKLLQTGYDLSKVTILETTTGAGGVTFSTPTKMGLFTVEELRSRVKVLYAGRIAELLLFKDEKHVTTGASNDIEQATKLIRDIISSYGMDENIGMLNLQLLGVEKEELFKRANLLSSTLYKETKELMEANWTHVSNVANALLEKNTISEEDLEQIMNGHHSAHENVSA